LVALNRRFVPAATSAFKSEPTLERSAFHDTTQLLLKRTHLATQFGNRRAMRDARLMLS
jgi:hypothetical protein